MRPGAKFLPIFTKIVMPNGSHTLLSIFASWISNKLKFVVPFYVSNIKIQINQKLFKKWPKIPNEGPFATTRKPRTDHWRYAIAHQFFWLEFFFLVTFDCYSILVLIIYGFFTIIQNNMYWIMLFLLLFRCCDDE